MFVVIIFSDYKGAHKEVSIEQMLSWNFFWAIPTSEHASYCSLMFLFDFFNLIFRKPQRALYSCTKYLFPLKKLASVMLAFAKIHLYPTWRLHSNIDEGEIESPLR